MSESLQKDLLANDEFNFFIPVQLAKAGKKEDGRRWIQGIASTSSRDLQGETVLQNGIDYGYFLKHGYINDDHKSGPEHKVGEPTEARMTKAGFWIKGFLYKGKERSDYWWEHLNALAQSESSRKVGFSIQGKIIRRKGKSIEKCWLQDVAITASPVNTNTWAEICKSLSLQTWCLHPWNPGCQGGRCGQCGCTAKAILDPGETLDGECEDEKALSTVSGAPMMPESLEGSAKVQTHKGLISYDEAIQELQLSKGYSRVAAETIADSIFAANRLVGGSR